MSDPVGKLSEPEIRNDGWYERNVDKRIQALHALCDRKDERIAELEAELAQARALLTEHVPDGHYAHFDPQMTAGANCPACQARREWRERVDAALRAKEEGG